MILKRFLKIILTITFLVSIIVIVKYIYNKIKLNNYINNLIADTELSEIPFEDTIPMLNVDFANLKETNSETVGWIQVLGTDINYPFVQHKDNDYYLTHSFNKTYSNAGWVFMDYRNTISPFDTNTILYAHRMRDNTMFSTLKNVLSNEWFENSDNHIIKISMENSNSLWQIFSTYHIPTTGDYLDINFEEVEEHQNFLDLITDRSEHNFNIKPSLEDNIITLSTCYDINKERMVVHAKLIKYVEK